MLPDTKWNKNHNNLLKKNASNIYLLKYASVKSTFFLIAKLKISETY